MHGGRRSINTQRLADNAPLTDGLRRKAVNARRAATGVQNVLSDIKPDLAADAVVALEQALHTLGLAATAYEDAHKIRKKRDGLREVRRKEAEAIAARLFGHLSTVAEKVALIACVAPYELLPERLQRIQAVPDSHRARGLLSQGYRHVIETIAFHISSCEGDMETFAAGRLAQFEATREQVQAKYAHAITVLNDALSRDSASSA